MIFQLIYTCAFNAGAGTTDLEVIARESRDRNQALNITGILLYSDGSILQVLEGDKKSVKDLYAKIQKDSRVSNTLILIERLSTEREFPNWSMGYKNAVQKRDNIFDLNLHSLSKKLPPQPSQEIQTFGTIFARVNGLA